MQQIVLDEMALGNAQITQEAAEAINIVVRIVPFHLLAPPSIGATSR